MSFTEMRISFRSILFVATLVAAGLGTSGCKTTESENLSARPWNAPTTWQNGLPSNINEGR